MTPIERMLKLAGKAPAKELAALLEATGAKLTSAISDAIELTKQGQQVDEGLFTNLKAMLSVASTVSKSGAGRVGSLLKKVGASVKELYLDKKAQAELTILVKGMIKVIDTLDKLAENAPTIIARDKEVAKELDMFKALLLKTIDTLATRQAIKEGISAYDARGLTKLMEEVYETDPLSVTHTVADLTNTKDVT